MKKILLTAAICLSALSAMAEGYQINTLSAKQIGMGHTGVGMKLGAESMIFNPAGLGFSDKTLDITGSITGIKANATAEWADGKQHTDNGFSTPLAFNAAFKIYDNLQAGVSFYTPYGSAIKWGDNWPGAILNQNVKLQTFTVQPTVSWRINKHFSIGAGLMLSWGKVDLNKALMTGAMGDMLGNMVTAQTGIPVAPYGNVSPVSANLKGNADPAVGVNLGVMYEINNKWTVGLNWRSKQMMKVKTGTVNLSYARDDEPMLTMLKQQLSHINEATFTAEMPMPQIIQAGVSFKPNDKLILAADVQYTGWKTYKQLDIEFPDLSEALQEQFNQHLTKNYSDAWCFHIGAQYAITNRFDVRAGMMIDTTPCDKNYYNPETPGMTKIEPTVGFSFRPIDRLSIDFGFMYVAGLGMDNATGRYTNFITKQENTFTADYRCHAFAPAFGISYSF